MVSRRDFVKAGLALPLVCSRQTGWAVADSGNFRALVILAEFSDLPQPADIEPIRRRFGRLNNFVREMSDGQHGVEVTFSGWHRLPGPVGRYAISAANLEVNPDRVYQLIQDAIDAGDSVNDFREFDYVVLFLGATQPQYGMIGLCGYPGMLGWRREIVFRTRSGQRVPGGVAIFSSSAHPGTLFHDCAHIWGGVRNGKRVVPCLYDHDLQIRYPTRERGWSHALINMGYWDPMSCHFVRGNLPPPGISSWTRLRLGWLDSARVATCLPGENAEFLLGALADPLANCRAIRIPLTASTFFLIENRQPISVFETPLPGRGVLLMRGDDSIEECRNGMAPVRLVDAHPETPFLNGAAFSLAGRTRYSDPASGLRLTLLAEEGTAIRLRLDWQA